MDVRSGQLWGFVCNERRHRQVFRRGGDKSGTAAAESAKRSGNDIPVAWSRQANWPSC